MYDKILICLNYSILDSVLTLVDRISIKLSSSVCLSIIVGFLENH